ncbi:MAG: tetratricopeptide repeat protein [Candidatus Dormibacteria bacterium]
MTETAEQVREPSALPDGEVTYVFTDIEGSTRMWESNPEAMADALRSHDQVVAATVAEQGGTIVRSRGEGDSFFAVFVRPVAAVAAVAEMQRRLADQEWPEGVSISVRVALNHGTADLRAGNYYGQAVNRCARLRGVAHGGQVLLSQTVVALVEAELPAGTGLRDLGLHRLRDLAGRERVYQLDIDGLPNNFPLLRSLDSLPHNLPTQLTSFVGREAEIGELRQRLGSSRLLSLIGAGGCGKTRLGMQLAAEVADAHDGGVWMVELAPLTDPRSVPLAVANVLGVRELPGVDLEETMAAWLASRDLLLFLDNCEHLVAQTAALVEGLLARCPRLRVLVTSREPLGIHGEHTWRVPSLSIPRVSEGSESSLATSDAVRLFCERAATAGAPVPAEPAELAVVAEICRRLDGIPLAIELAAARTGVLSPRQVAQRLDDRFRLLRNGSRSVLPRQQTLEATVDWSYELLTEDERSLLRRLSVFPGGWTIEAAEAVCAGEGLEAGAILDLLSQLVSKSLVVVDPGPLESRYRMLETIRQYSAVLLRADPAGLLAHRNHQEWYQALAADCERRLAAGQGEAWDLLEAEYDNLRGALEWSLLHPGSAEEALTLAASLGEFWDLRCALAEGRRWLELTLSRAPAAPDSLRARALNALGMLVSHQGDYRTAQRHFEEALSLARRGGDQRVVATTLGNYGWMQWSEGRADEARRHLSEGLDLARELSDPMLVARSLYLFSHVEATEGVPNADALARESLALARRLGEPSIEGRSLYFLGVTAIYRGRFDEGRRHMEESIAIARRVGDRWQLPWSLSFLAFADLLTGQLNEAVDSFEEALGIARESGNNWCVARCLGGLAWCRVLTADPVEALTLAQQSLGLSHQIGARIDTALAASFMADFARAGGRREEAEDLHREALRDNQSMRNAWGVAQSLERLARLALDRADSASAAWLYGAAGEIRRRHDCPVPPLSRHDVAEGVARVEGELGVACAEWRAGVAATAAQGVQVDVPEAPRSVESAG